MERDADLLLAPVNPTGTDKDPIYELIRALDSEKGEHEAGRLLYVAATRAKKSLHLLGDVKLDASGAPRPPPRAALLSKLWPVVQQEFSLAARHPATCAPASAGAEVASLPAGVELVRLPVSWALPTAPAAAQWPAGIEAPRGEQIEFSWAGETARHIGTVVHGWLQKIAREGIALWNDQRIALLDRILRTQLRSQGVGEAELAMAARRVSDALAAMLAEPRGRWLLGQHQGAQTEFRMMRFVNGRLRALVIDRTFVDQDGQRWIIDYKTSVHEGSDLGAFIDSEMERYRPQLEMYVALARALGPEPVRAALYFPLLGIFREL
jgi:ATP-dependent exoDNAse (exonuclease V) beta subunit